MKTVIVAGGRGTRLTEETVVRPKPMVEIGGKPILWHILKIYSAYDFHDFVIATGYKGEQIKEYFANFQLHNADIVVDLANKTVELCNRIGPQWRVAVVDTGLNTEIGGRLKRLAAWIGDETFMMTYGDAVGTVDIRALIEFHRRHGRLATLTAVRPPARFGGLEFDGDRVARFKEKPQIGEGWINGGFMVLEPQVLDYIEGDGTVFEREPLERLAEEGQLMAYRHEGFWQPMDTLREKLLLEELWQSGSRPWKVWD